MCLKRYLNILEMNADGIPYYSPFPHFFLKPKNKSGALCNKLLAAVYTNSNQILKPATIGILD